MDSKTWEGSRCRPHHVSISQSERRSDRQSILLRGQKRKVFALSATYPLIKVLLKINRSIWHPLLEKNRPKANAKDTVSSFPKTGKQHLTLWPTTHLPRSNHRLLWAAIMHTPQSPSSPVFSSIFPCVALSLSPPTSPRYPLLPLVRWIRKDAETTGRLSISNPAASLLPIHSSWWSFGLFIKKKKNQTEHTRAHTDSKPINCNHCGHWFPVELSQSQKLKADGKCMQKKIMKEHKERGENFAD